MKWNIFVGSMVLGACLSGQSFGGDLIHRLLGGNGVGAKSSCCDTSVVDPSCGAEMAGGRGPSCGTEIAAPACDPCAGAGAGIGGGKAGCGLLGKRGPSCGTEIAGACDPCAGGNGGIVGPSCGVESSACGSAPVCRTPVLDGLKGLKCKLHAAHVDLGVDGGHGGLAADGPQLDGAVVAAADQAGGVGLRADKGVTYWHAHVRTKQW